VRLNDPTSLQCSQVVVHNLPQRSVLRWLGALALILGVPVVGAMLGLFGAVGALCIGVLFLLLAARATTTERAGATLLLTDDALRLLGPGVEQELVFPLSTIESGYATSNERKVVLHSRGGLEIGVVLTDDDAPTRLLEHAGVGIAQRALTLPLRGQLGAFTIGFIAFWPLLFVCVSLAGAILHDASAILLGLLMAAIATTLVVLRFGFPRVVVGADGVRVLLVRHRFVPYDQIAKVELIPSPYVTGPPTIRVVLHDGFELPLPTIAAPSERIEGLAERIREAARNHAGGAARRLDSLARAGRPVAAWKADVERMALAPPGFRDHALGIDDFERVLGDAAAPADQRIGAALALRALDPVAAAPRIRVAAEASADEALREALAAAEGGELDEALVDRASRRKAAR
jgi:hypothetical protein